MSVDPTGIPVSGAILLTAAAYAVFSLYVSGAVVSKRTIEKSRWPQQCERAVVEAVRYDTPQLQTVPPQISCKGAVGIFTDKRNSDTDAICGLVDLFLDHSPVRQIENQNRKLIEAHKTRVAAAAANAGSKCTCASRLVESDRVPWAIFAGSWRTIKPSEIGNLKANLNAALTSPLCAGVAQ